MENPQTRRNRSHERNLFKGRKEGVKEEKERKEKKISSIFLLPIPIHLLTFYLAEGSRIVEIPFTALLISAYEGEFMDGRETIKN